MKIFNLVVVISFTLSPNYLLQWKKKNYDIRFDQTR